MSSTNLIFRVVERDIRILFTDTFLIGIMFANFAIDLFVTAATFGNLIGYNYFLRIAPGSNLITAMVAAFQSGRDIWREKYIKDLASYLLTLPVPRRVFAISRIAGGVARSVIATIPGIRVFDRSVRDGKERNPAIPLIPQHHILRCYALPVHSATDSSDESDDLGDTGFQGVRSSRINTVPNLDSCGTLARFRTTRSGLLSMVCQTLIRLD